MPKISIVIAVYNNKRYLKSAVESVTSQACDDYEIIIIDDGSTDGTDDLVDKIASENKKIIAYHQENQWIYASFNNGIKKANGEYIYILNSDDKFAKGALLQLAKAIDKYNHPDVIWTRVRLINCDENQNVLEAKNVNPDIKEDRFLDLDADKEGWLAILNSGVMMNQANLYKRDIMLKHPFRNDVYGADYLFNIDAAKDIHTCAFLNCEIYQFFEYQDKNMNASAGKYYGYEHQMFNEFYLGVKQLMKDKEIFSEENMERFRAMRRQHVVEEIKWLLTRERTMTYEEKLAILENNTWDDVLGECYTKSGRDGYETVLKRELEKYKTNETG